MRSFLVLLSIVSFSYAFSQGVSVHVNTDGTHMVMHNHGAVSHGVNSDGSTSVIHNHGNVSHIFKSDGTTSVIHNHRKVSHRFHSDGSSSVIHRHGKVSNYSRSEDASGPIQNQEDISEQQTNYITTEERGAVDQPETVSDLFKMIFQHLKSNKNSSHESDNESVIVEEE